MLYYKRGCLTCTMQTPIATSGWLPERFTVKMHETDAGAPAAEMDDGERADETNDGEPADEPDVPRAIEHYLQHPDVVNNQKDLEARWEALQAWGRKHGIGYIRANMQNGRIV